MRKHGLGDYSDSGERLSAVSTILALVEHCSVTEIVIRLIRFDRQLTPNQIDYVVVSSNFRSYFLMWSKRGVDIGLERDDHLMAAFLRLHIAFASTRRGGQSPWLPKVNSVRCREPTIVWQLELFFWSEERCFEKFAGEYRWTLDHNQKYIFLKHNLLDTPRKCVLRSDRLEKFRSRLTSIRNSNFFWRWHRT